MPIMQLIRLTKNTGGDLWVNPAQIVYAEVYEKKSAEPKDPKAKDQKPDLQTILHTGTREKEGKIFVKEHPDEINSILRNMKHEKTVKKTVVHK